MASYCVIDQRCFRENTRENTNRLAYTRSTYKPNLKQFIQSNNRLILGCVIKDYCVKVILTGVFLGLCAN